MQHGETDIKIFYFLFFLISQTCSCGSNRKTKTLTFR